MSGAICPLHQHQTPRSSRVKGQTEVPQSLKHHAVAHGLVPVLPPMAFSEPCPKSLHHWVLSLPLGCLSECSP